MLYIKENNNMIDIKKLKKINPNVYYMGLVGFFMNFAATLVYTTILLFVGGDKNIFSNNSLILIRTFSEALANFSKIFSGFVSDKLQNRKSFLLVGYSCMLLAKLGFILLTFKELFPLFFLQCIYIFNQIFERCMNAIRDPARDAILMENSTPDTRGVCFGVRKFVTSFGSILSGLLTGFLLFLWQKNYSNLFLYKYVLLPPIFLMACIVSYITNKQSIIFIFSLGFLILGGFVARMHFSSMLYIVSLIPVFYTIITVYMNIKEHKKAAVKTKDIIDLNLLRKNFKKTKTILLLLVMMCFLSLGKLNDYALFSRGMDLGISKYLIPFMFRQIYTLSW